MESCVKKFLQLVTAANLLICGITVAADELSEKRLGDAALSVGDYRNAISSYESALVLANDANNAEIWAESALKLGFARLCDGNLTGARAIYNEFRRRNPLRSAGTLHGDLLAAEGKYLEAERFFSTLTANDPVLADAATFSRGMLKLRTGNLPEAYKLFMLLAEKPESDWKYPAVNEAVYILIRMGKAASAFAELGRVPADKRSSEWELLRYFAEAESGKIDEFKSVFNTFIEKQTPRPQSRLVELLSSAAKAAVKKGDDKFAVECLTCAVEWVQEEALKRELLRRLINIYAEKSPLLALEQAEKYVSLFPSADDGGQILLNIGKLLAGKNEYSKAFQIFTQISQNSLLKNRDRLSGAAEAIAVAGKMPENPGVDSFYLMLTTQSDIEERIFWMVQFSNYFEKQKKYAEAGKILQQALEIAPDKIKEKLHFDLLNFFIRTGNLSGVRREADYLAGSAKPLYQATANFELGKIYEKQGNFSDSRKFYLSAGKFADTPLQKPALFSAAIMAYKMQQYAVAAGELEVFAEKYPDYSRTPEALFHAFEAYNSSGNSKAAALVAEKLKKNYAQSDALAVFFIRQALQRGNDGDLSGAIAELEKIEETFSGSPLAQEAAMHKAIFLERYGSYDEALKIFVELFSGKSSVQIAAESAIRAGEILSRRNKFAEAGKLFMLAAEKNASPLFSDVALIRAVDCVLAQNSADHNLLNETAVKCEKLAAETRFPEIRLQALYKLGLVREQSGEYDKAVSAYEKLIYAALDTRQQGIQPDPQWCIKAVESALQLISTNQRSGALQRGMLLINRFNSLNAVDAEEISQLKKSFRNQLKTRRRK